MPEVSCVPRHCASPQGLIRDTQVTVENETHATIECKNTSYHFWGSKISPTQKIEMKCLLRSGKLPVWRFDGLTVEEAKDIACYDGALCLLPPPDFNNKKLLSNYDGKRHYRNSRDFSFSCPSNETSMVN